jgi:hypothetical protein
MTGVAGNDWSNQRQELVTLVDANSQDCRINYHFKFTRNGEVVSDLDSWIPLKQIANIVVMPTEQYLKDVDAKGGHPSWTPRIDPPTWHLKTVRADGTFNRIAFSDQDLADRVAKAMVHAVELCGGGSKEPF